MRLIFLTIFTLLFSLGKAQVFPGLIGIHNSKAGTTTQRILFDLGGTGTTPNPGATTTSPSGGLYWNNISSSGANKTVWSTDPVDVTNTTVTGFNIYVSTKPGGTFSVGDSSTNGGGYTTAVSDYPITAVQDNVYFYTGVAVNVTFVIPAGKTASIKFWGGRNAAGPRILQIKKSTDGSYTQEYDATFNQTYTTAVTFTGITGTQVFNMQVKAGSTFGHISVIDVTLN